MVRLLGLPSLVALAACICARSSPQTDTTCEEKESEEFSTLQLHGVRDVAAAGPKTGIGGMKEHEEVVSALQTDLEVEEDDVEADDDEDDDEAAGEEDINTDPETTLDMPALTSEMAGNLLQVDGATSGRRRSGRYDHRRRRRGSSPRRL